MISIMINVFVILIVSFIFSTAFINLSGLLSIIIKTSTNTLTRIFLFDKCKIKNYADGGGERDDKK